jgi:hypothetical protein
MNRKTLKIADIVIILLSLGVTVFSGFTAYVKPANTIQVMIEGQEQHWVYPLDAEETVNVKGPLGTTIVRIHNNEAWVESSPCENQTCVGMGHVTSDSLIPWVACLPNNVFFMIERSDELRKITDTNTW